MNSPHTGKLDFSHHLKFERDKRGWSQAKVAELLQTDIKTISRWERGTGLPASYLRQKLSDVFGKDLQALGLFEEVQIAPFVSLTDLFDPMIPLPPAYPLIGRDDQLALLRKRLRGGGNVTLSALNGLPGVGKTALSITLAYDPALQAHFKDGILWAGLGPEPNVQSHLSRWGAMLGMSASEMSHLQDIDAWGIAVHRVLGSRTILLVIDDAWTAKDALALKIGGPGCAHLITTRFPTIATQITVDGATEVKELDTAEGFALLRTLAPQVVEQQPERARELVLAVGGLPLALTLLGNYLRMQAYMVQPRRIMSALQRLGERDMRLDLTETRSPAERHSSQPGDGSISLRTIIAVSDEQLDQHTREAFYALSIFPPKPNSFSEEAALAVSESDIQVLDTLLDTGLLQSSGPARYTLHQTIADYARAQIQEDRAQRRFLRFFCAFVKRYSTNYAFLETESNNIFAALDIAFELTQFADLLSLINALMPFFQARGLFLLAEIHLRRAYNTALPFASFSEHLHILSNLGEVNRKMCQYDQAESFFEEGLALARQSQKISDQIMFLSLMGTLEWKRGAYAKAEAYLQEGLLLARTEKGQPSLYAILEVLSSLVQRRGEYAQGEKYMREAIAAYRDRPEKDVAQLSVMIDNLGLAYLAQGFYEKADREFETSLSLARQATHWEWVAMVLNNLAESKKHQGDYIQAEAYFQEGLELARRIGLQEWVCVLLAGGGEIARKQGLYEKARMLLQESLQLAHTFHIPQMACSACFEFCQIALREGHYDQAEQYLLEMKNVVPDGDSLLLALADYSSAQVCAGRGNTKEARRLALRALEKMAVTYAIEVEEFLASLPLL